MGTAGLANRRISGVWTLIGQSQRCGGGGGGGWGRGESAPILELQLVLLRWKGFLLNVQILFMPLQYAKTK